MPALVADTSSSSAAGQWIRDRWQSWLDLELEFPRLMHRASTAAARAGQAGDESTRRAAKESIERTRKLWHMHAYLTERVEGIVGLIPSGLGSLVWPAAAAALAVSIAWVITHYDAELRIVKLLEEERLTPELARELLAEVEGGGPPLSIGGVVKALPLLALGGFAWWLWRSIPRGGPL